MYSMLCASGVAGVAGVADFTGSSGGASSNSARSAGSVDGRCDRCTTAAGDVGDTSVVPDVDTDARWPLSCSGSASLAVDASREMIVAFVAGTATIDAAGAADALASIAGVEATDGSGTATACTSSGATMSGEIGRAHV